MDKEKEVKRYREYLFQSLGEVSMCWNPIPNGVFDSSKAKEIGERLFQAHEQLLKAERTKREEAEKKYQDHRDATLDGDCQICDYEAYNAKIKELEAKVKELEQEKDGLIKASMHRRDSGKSVTKYLIAIYDLESQLATTNKELETERLRLATCGVVGWSENLENAKVADKYKSDSLDAVVNLVNKLASTNAKIVELESEVERLKEYEWKYKDLCK